MLRFAEDSPKTGPVGKQPFPTAAHACTVVSNEWVNARYKHLVLDAPVGALAVQPGQFFHLLCPPTAAERPFLRRPMSIYQVRPDAGRLAFLYLVKGAGTRAMATLAAGDTFDIFGPLGNVFRLDPAWRHIAVVVRGVGLATLAPLAEMARDAEVGTTAVLSARSPDDIMSVDVMTAAGAKVHTVTDTDGSSDVAAVESLLRRIMADRPVDALFTCGSNRLLQLLQRLAEEHGIPGQVALEQQMACALGMCFCCVRPIRRDGQVQQLRVCHAGPVFDLSEAISW
jgi:dihydroorotate dehydrogenase electron transfer subunit